MPAEQRAPAEPLADLAAWASIELLGSAARLGLLDTLADAPPGGATAAEIAAKAGTDPAATRDLLHGLVTAGYAGIRADRFQTSPQLQQVLAAPSASFPVDLRAYLDLALALPAALAAASRPCPPAGATAGDLGEISARLAAPSMECFLIDHWIAAVPGAADALERGISVLDAGCGRGQATRLIGRRFPRSQVTGIDADRAAAVTAAEHPRRPQNAGYWHAQLEGFPGDFDLVLLLHTLHETADPDLAVKRLSELLNPGGTLVIVEAATSGHPDTDTTVRLSTLNWLASVAHSIPASRSRGGPAPGAMWDRREILALLNRPALTQAAAVGAAGGRTVFWARRAA